MTKRDIAYGALGALALILAAGTSVRADEPTDTRCHVNIDTDRGSGGWHVQQCGNSLGVGFSGPIKDVDIAHPGGKGKAFVPQAGRDIERATHDVGHAVEAAGQWMGDRLGIHF